MSKTYELSYTAERIDEMLKEVDEHTIYSDATTKEHGLMSATDKTKLEALPTAQQIDGSLNAKVDKETGKGLSKNDYTDAEKAKVASALQTETDPTVPSWAKQSNKPSYDYSEIGNTPDLSGFITKSVDDLANYYLKSETYTKAEVAALIGAIQQFHYEIYATLPQSGASNVLYLIGPTGSGADKYEEYVYANNAWTKIGDTSIDLSGYVTTSALNTALSAYTSTSDLTTLLSNKADKVSNATSGDFASLDANGNLTDSGHRHSDYATAAQGTKADTAVQSVTVGATTTGAAGTDASVTNSGTSTNPVLNFTIPKGADGHDGADAVNPFKGWFASAASLPANPVVGDFAYVKGATTSDPVAIYECTTAGSWSDSGRTVDTSNAQTFETGEQVNQTKIDNTGLSNPEANALTKATDVMQLKAKLEGVSAEEVAVDKSTLQDYEFSTAQTNKKGYYDKNGDFIPSTSNISVKIDVYGYKSMRFFGALRKAAPSAGQPCYCFLDDNDAIISGTLVEYDLDVNLSENTTKEYNITIPDGAVFALVLWKGVGGLTNAHFYCYLTDGMNVNDLVNEKTGNIPYLELDMYGGRKIMNEFGLDLTWNNMQKVTGYLQNERWFYGSSKSAYYKLSDGYNYLHVTGNENNASLIYFTTKKLPNETVDESDLKTTYFPTGQRSTSVFSVPADGNLYIRVPEGSAYVYINKVGASSASDEIPGYLSFIEMYEGFNCIKRVSDLEEKLEDSYFDSNVVPYDITKSIGNTLIPINVDVDNGGHVIPQSIQEKNIQSKAKQFALIRWTSKGNIPYKGDTSNPDSPEDESGGAFSEGTTTTGLPYSSVKEIDKYIGFDVSVLTFMTAVNNPYSLLYTENVGEETSKSDWGFSYHGSNCATYYGTVCSEFSSYAVGMSVIIPTHGHKWLSEYAMKAVRLYSQTENNLKIGDILVRYKKSTMSAMHCMVVVDIVRNSVGNVTGFKVAESTGSHVRYTSRTTISDSGSTTVVIAYRFTELYKNIGYENSADEFIDLSLLPNPTYSPSGDATVIANAQKTYTYNNDICTFAGDKACFAEGDLIVLNYNLNNDANFQYTGIELYKGNVLIGTYTIAEIDQSELPEGQRGHALKLGTTLAHGSYKARCISSGNESDYTYFEVIETSNVSINSDFEKKCTTINFASANGQPVCIGLTNISGGQLIMRELTEGEIAGGQINSDFEKLYKEQMGKDLTTEAALWIKLYFQGKYGRVVAKLPYKNVN